MPQLEPTLVPVQRPQSRWDEGASGNAPVPAATIIEPDMPPGDWGQPLPPPAGDWGQPSPPPLVSGKPPVSVKVLRMQSTQIRVLLGKGGVTIRDIIAKTGAEIKFDQAKPDDPEGELTIVGNVERTEALVRDVLAAKGCPLRTLNGPAGNVQPVPADEEDLIVPPDLVGLFIGRGGENIKEMREKIGGDIFIGVQPATHPGAPQRIQLVGDNREKAKEIVREKLLEIKTRAKGREKESVATKGKGKGRMMFPQSALQKGGKGAMGYDLHWGHGWDIPWGWEVPWGWDASWDGDWDASWDASWGCWDMGSWDGSGDDSMGWDMAGWGGGAYSGMSGADANACGSTEKSTQPVALTKDTELGSTGSSTQPVDLTKDTVLANGLLKALGSSTSNTQPVDKTNDTVLGNNLGESEGL